MASETPTDTRPASSTLRLSASFAALLCVVLAAMACGSDSPGPLIRRLEPAPGTTAVDRQIRPVIELNSAASWALDASAPQLLLFDVTGGAKQRVGGSIEIEGKRATYIPSADLVIDHDYLLVLERSGVAGLCEGGACGNDDVLENDASEFPEQPLTWPLSIAFSTASRPAVRAVSMDGSGRLVVSFSQPMDAIVTSPQFSLTDQLNKIVPLGPAVWTDEDNRDARLDIETELAALDLYTLKVDRKSQAADGTRLDGDGDGEAGEIDDHFTVRFTGSQRPVVLSRYPQASGQP